MKPLIEQWMENLESYRLLKMEVPQDRHDLFVIEARLAFLRELVADQAVDLFCDNRTEHEKWLKNY